MNLHSPPSKLSAASSSERGAAMPLLMPASFWLALPEPLPFGEECLSFHLNHMKTPKMSLYPQWAQLSKNNIRGESGHCFPHTLRSSEEPGGRSPQHLQWLNAASSFKGSTPRPNPDIKDFATLRREGARQMKMSTHLMSRADK